MTRDGCKGGEGRSDESVREDTKVMLLSVALIVACALLACLGTWAVWRVVEWMR